MFNFIAISCLCIYVLNLNPLFSVANSAKNEQIKCIKNQYTYIYRDDGRAPVIHKFLGHIKLNMQKKTKSTDIEYFEDEWK